MFFFVLVYVAIIAAKLVRLQRETAELVELARRKSGRGRVTFRTREYAATVVTRPLPLQAPTAFVRIRPRGVRLCGEARSDDGAPLPGSLDSPPLASSLREPGLRSATCSSLS